MTSRADSMLGRTLGDFIVRERIGSGGVGEVFRAEQVTLGREAVIKVLSRNRELSTPAADRFLREARLASRLDHPFAAHIYAFGAEPDGMLWIAMELVRGIPLDRLISTQGPLPLARFVPFFERLAEVLYAAHEQGIIHRDVKPANVMVLSRTGRLLPKLLDLGIARADSSSRPATQSVAVDIETLSDEPVDDGALSTSGELMISKSRDATLAGMVIGTPHFMAPEQWSDASRADVRSDVYSLAILAYQAITGRLPFKGHSLRSMARAHAKHALPELGEGLPNALYAVLAKATAKRPEDRYASALELSSALRVASGLEFEAASLPQLDDGLRETVLAQAPQPIAEAVAMLEGARSPRQAVDAVSAVQRVVTRHLAMMALAARARIGAGGEDDTEEVLGLIKRAAAGRIDDDAWRALTVGLVQPFADRRDAHPVPELVAVFFTGDGRTGTGALALERLAQLPWPGLEAAQDELIAFLHQAIPAAGQVLSTLSFLFDYSLVVRRNDAERWMGTRRSRRVPQDVLGPQPVDGEVALLNSAGSMVLTLSPLVQLIAPSGGAIEELFYFDGPGRHGARLLALPGPFERQDSELWGWFSQNITDVLAPVHRVGRDEHEPYKGLSAFTAHDADNYFGREKEAQGFANRMRAEPLLAVVGPSGAGKSSFISAGVVPLLPRSWRTVVMRPGTSPLAALEKRMMAEKLGAEGLAARVRRDPLALANHVAGALAPGETLLLVLDQFEELVTLCADVEERQAFARAVAHSADLAGSRVRVVMTLRDDFLIQITQLSAFRDRLSSALQLLATPAPDDLMRVVIEPARRVGFGFDDETLPKRMVDAVAEHSGALALLSFTASQMWLLRDRHLRQMRAKTYEAIGGVGGALANHAERTLAQLAMPQQRLVREAFRQLVTGQGTRAVLSRKELLEVLGNDAAADEVLETLVSARLLISGEGDGHETRTELIHESLIHSWPRLVEWLREDAETARLRDALRSSARHWLERGRPRGLLWREETLAEFQLWRARFSGGLTEAERAFADASVRAQARGQLIRRAFAAAAFVALAAGLVVVAQAYRSAEAALGESRASATKAQQRLANLRQEQGRLAMLENKPLEALAYLDAARTAGAQGPALDHMLNLATWLTRGEIRRFGEADPSTDDVLSPDEKTLAIFHEGHVTLWDVASGVIRSKIKTAAVAGAFAPDGQLALINPEGTLDFFDQTSGALKSKIEIGKGTYFSVEFDSQGKFIVLSGVGDQVRIVRRSGEVIATPAAPGALRLSTKLNQDGRVVAIFAGPSVATPTSLRDVRLVNVETGALAFKIHLDDPARQVVFGPLDRFAIADSNGQLSMANVGTKRVEWQRREHAGPIQSVSFSPGGDRLMSLGFDGKVVIWDATDGRKRQSVTLASGPLRAGFWLDSRWIVVQLPDGVLQKVNVETGERDWRFVGDAARASVWRTSDGATILTSAPNGVIRSWDASTSGGKARLAGHHVNSVFGSGVATNQAVASNDGWFVLGVDDDSTTLVRAKGAFGDGDVAAQISTDGTHLVRALERTVQVLNEKSGFELTQTLTDTSSIFSIAIDAAGSRIAMQTDSGEISLWSGTPFTKVATISALGSDRHSPGFFVNDELITGSTTGVLERWDAKSGQSVSRRQAFNSLILPLQSSVPDRFFAVTLNGAIQVWSLNANSLITEVPGLGVLPLAVEMDPAGHLLSEFTPDGSWSTWDLQEHRLLSRVITIGPLRDAVTSRGTVALVSHEGSLVAWPAIAPSFSAEQTARAVRCGPSELRDDRLEERDADRLLACASLPTRE